MFTSLTYIGYLLLAALSLLGPYALYKLFSRKTVVEQTMADLTMIGLDLNRHAKDYNFVNAFLADGRNFIVEIQESRRRQLQSQLLIKALITISKSALGASHVSSVTWPGETIPEVVEKNNGGLYLAIVYLLLGMGATAFALQAQVYTMLGHIGMAFAAAMIACALTLLCYILGGLGLLVGINFGCASGMLLGIWLRQSNLPSTTGSNQAHSLT